MMHRSRKQSVAFLLAAVLAGSSAAVVVDAARETSWLRGVNRFLRSLVEDDTAAAATQTLGSGYVTRTNVLDQTRIDLDLRQMNRYMEENEGGYGFTLARNMYEKGGYAKPVATVSLPKLLQERVTKGTVFTGQNSAGDPVRLLAYEDTAEQAPEIQLQYDGEPCYVGGIHRKHGLADTDPGDQTWDGCLKPEGIITIADQDLGMEYNYTVYRDNSNAITVQKFSTEASSRMRPGTDGSRPYYTDFQKFVDYYGAYDYADKWIMAALKGNPTDFTNGNADFAGLTDFHARKEAVKYGAPFISVQMYIIRQMEAAIHDCEVMCETDECNNNMFANLDAAVALYTGSTEDGNDSGNLLFTMADHRAGLFKTAGEDGTEEEGMSMVNHQIFREFNEFQRHLDDKDCEESALKKEHIVRHIFVPLIQGTIEYAHKRRDGNESNRTMVEGATWAASVLPMIHNCSHSDAQIIYDNMKVGDPDKAVDFASVKQAFERNYKCLKITCEEVGGLWDSETKEYKRGAEPCSSSPDVTDDGTDDGDDKDDGKVDIAAEEEAKDVSDAEKRIKDDYEDSKGDTHKDNISHEDEEELKGAVSGVKVSKGGSDSGGSSAGVAIGILAVFVVVGLAAVLYVRRSKRAAKVQKQKNKPNLVVFESEDKDNDRAIC